jgi:hypothetical protein
MFGVPAKAVDFASFSSAYENLWDIYNTDLLPYNWQLKLSPAQRTQAAESGRTWLGLYRERLQQLQPPASDAQARWLAQVSLYGTFFEYSLRRLELHTRLFDLVTPYKAQVEASQPLPAEVRQSVITVYQELYRCAEPFAAQTKLTPGDMLRATEPMTSPYKEWVAGFNGWLEAKLDFKQFAGSLNVSPLEVAAGQPFELTVELANRGVCPWIPGVGHRLLLEGDFKKLGLPETVDLAGEWVLPGDKRRLTLKGSAPATSGQSEFTISFVSPFYLFQAVMDNRVQLVWK